MSTLKRINNYVGVFTAKVSFCKHNCIKQSKIFLVVNFQYSVYRDSFKNNKYKKHELVKECSGAFC